VNRIAAAVVMLAVVSPALAQTPEPVASPGKARVTSALDRAKRENQRVLVEWTASWCPPLKDVEQLVASDKEIAKKILYEYQLVPIDMDAEKALRLEIAQGESAALSVLDEAGKTLASFGPTSSQTGVDRKALLAFLAKWQPAPLDAKAVLAEGRDTAAKLHRRVFLHFGAPWCPWCRKLEEWMARGDVAPLLAKDYVDVKIDVDRTTGGKELLASYRKKDEGIPWFAILDDSGAAVATSDGPKGNIGYPSAPEEIEHFLSMLKTTATNLGESDLAALGASLAAAGRQPAAH
jgi:thiol:disulfide interchange protein